MQRLLWNKQSNFLLLLILSIGMSISACGFHLRGMTSNLNFDTVSVQGANLSLKRQLLRNITANDLTLVDDVKEADVVLELINESNRKRIQSLAGTGVVREFELYYQVSFRMREGNNPEWGKTQTLQLRRDYSYNDEIVLGKAEEEARLNDDMRNDAIREIMRRLSFIKAPKAK